MQDAFAHCEALVRAADKDRFVATLFAPVGKRASLFALYAFNLEIARVRAAVRDPMAGEIRLQWWHDALSADGPGEAASHPVAAALRATMARHDLPAGLLREIVAARRFDLYDEPMATLADLERYADAVSVGLLRLAARILDPACEIGTLAIAAGRAHAIAGLIQAVPDHAARGQSFLPLAILQRHGAGAHAAMAAPASPELRAAIAELAQVAHEYLAQGRSLVGQATVAVVPALLPAATVGTTLKSLARANNDPFAMRDFPQWRRQWLIWRAAHSPVRIFS